MSKAIFRFYDNEEHISEDFQLYMMKQRERILQKISTAQQQPNHDKKPEFKYYAFLSQAFLSRIDPPMLEEYYFDQWQEILKQTPISFQENYDYYMEPLGEMTHTILFKREFKSLENAPVVVSFWDIFYRILILIKEFLFEINEESYKIE